MKLICGATLVAGLAIACIPQTVLADKQGDALLNKVKSAYKSLKSMSGTAKLTMASGGQKVPLDATMRLMKPNFMRLTMSAPFNQTVASDGKDLYTVMPGNQYMKAKATTSTLGNNMGGMIHPVTLFFGETGLFGGGAGVGKIQTKSLGKKKIGNITYDTLKISVDGEFKAAMTLFVDSKGLVYKGETNIDAGGNKVTMGYVMQNPKYNAAMDAKSFAYVLPKDAKEFDPTAPGPDDNSFDKSLVAVGKDAPAFAMPTPDGGSISLADALKGKKAVLINFWFYG